MSNFAKQLAKGFIRSAVNQVGRDGGRVLSNNIYKGENYIPVSNVTSQGSPVLTPIGNPYQDIPEDAISTTKPFTVGKMLFLGFLSFIFIPIGPIGVFIYGLLLMVDRSDKVIWYTTAPSYVRDRRFRTGVRYVGDATSQHSAKVMASPEIVNIKKRNGKIAMILGALGIILLISIMLFPN